MKKKIGLVIVIFVVTVGCTAKKMSPAFHETARVHTPEQAQAYEQCAKDPEGTLRMLKLAAPVSWVGQMARGGAAGMAARSLSLNPVVLIGSGVGLAVTGVKAAIDAGKQDERQKALVEYCLRAKGHSVIGWYYLSDPAGKLEPTAFKPVEMVELEKKLEALRLKKNEGIAPAAKVPESPQAATTVPQGEKPAGLVSKMPESEPNPLQADDKTMEQITKGLSDEKEKTKQKASKPDIANTASEPQKEMVIK